MVPEAVLGGVVRSELLHYLSLGPDVLRDAHGRRHELPPRRRRPIRKCFVEEDLYTLRFRQIRSTLIEQALFGEIDSRGSAAVSYWADFTHPSADRAALIGLLQYMSAQKLRTPKGLDWLAAELSTNDPNRVLRAMADLRTLHTAIWAECVWHLADASQSATKFIVTDHPVTVYTRACGPRNRLCRPPNDPDIRIHGSHTVFPLGLEKVPILTNRSWARNPYQSATKLRPNLTYTGNPFSTSSRSRLIGCSPRMRSGSKAVNGPTYARSIFHGLSECNPGDGKGYSVEYDLGRKYSSFTAIAGLSDVDTRGPRTVQFRIDTDGGGHDYFTSARGESHQITFDITGTLFLRLTVYEKNGSGPCITDTIAVWGDAQVRR